MSITNNIFFRGLTEKPERIFFIYSIIFGFIFLLVTPPFQSPDEITHFFRSYQVSEGTFVGEKRGGLSGGILPKSLENTSNYFSHIPFHIEKKIKPNELFSLINNPLEPNEKAFLSFPNTVLYSPIPYLPQAFGILLGRIFALSPQGLTYAGRIFNLLAWIFLISLAIKTSPIFKWVFLFLSLTPMSIFQSASLSADGFTNGISFLLIAKSLQCAIGEKKILNHWDLLQIFFLALFISLSKQAYFPLLLLFLMIPPKKFGSLKRFFIFIAICYSTNLIALGAWSRVAMDLYVPARPDVVTSISIQLQFILEHPLTYLSTLFHTLYRNWFNLLQQFIGILGWLDTVLPKSLWETYLIFLAFSAIADQKEGVQLGWKNRFVILISLSACIFLVCTMLYLHFAPIGGPDIPLQGRYFIPAAPLAFLLLYNRFIPQYYGSKFLTSVGIMLPPITLSWTLFILRNRYYE